MNIFLQALISGAAQGCVYALIALGTSVIFSTLRLGHFAQGDFYMFGVFIGLFLWSQVGLPVILVFIGAIVIVSVTMLVAERLAYRPMYSGSGTSLIMCTLGMQFVIQEIAKFGWGTDIVRFPPMFEAKVYRFGLAGHELTLSTQNVLVISIGVTLMLLLLFFMTKTKTGIAMNAVAMNRKAAALMGVKINTIIAATYVIAAALAAVTGVLMGPQYSARYSMGSTMGNKAMTAAIMGGFGNMGGAILGGMILGIAETMASLYISTAYKDVFSFIILIIVLFCRPQGLLGRARITKV
jgi:branched-chain amino acid transport system permease protein